MKLREYIARNHGSWGAQSRNRMIPARWSRVLAVLPQPTIPAIAAAVGMTKPQASGIVHRMQARGIMRKTDRWEVIK